VLLSVPALRAHAMLQMCSYAMRVIHLQSVLTLKAQVNKRYPLQVSEFSEFTVLLMPWYLGSHLWRDHHMDSTGYLSADDLFVTSSQSRRCLQISCNLRPSAFSVPRWRNAFERRG
jgi:hypothetical protein